MNGSVVRSALRTPSTVSTVRAASFASNGTSIMAKAMLRSLADRAHEVITGWALVHQDGRSLASYVTTRVHFRSLSDAVIDRYVATGEPMDKAGAYGIQGIGAMLVRAVDGSYTNVVGLPLVEVLDALPGALEELGVSAVSEAVGTLKSNK